MLGLDLGELAKFLYPVQLGDIRLWREAFYLPLVAVSAILSLNAFRRDAMLPFADSLTTEKAHGARSRPAYGCLIRIGLVLLAGSRGRAQLAAAGLDAAPVDDAGVSFTVGCAASVPGAGRGQSHCRAARDAAVDS